jgi:hypothetical protein
MFMSFCLKPTTYNYNKCWSDGPQVVHDNGKQPAALQQPALVNATASYAASGFRNTSHYCYA